MTRLERANLDALVFARLERDPSAKEAFETLRGRANTDLDRTRLLRHHRDGAVRGRELELREGVDRVLALYELLEIGIYARALPETLPPELREQAREVLGLAPMRAYYEEHYPLPLVTRFAARLRGEHDDRVSATHADEAVGVFRALLETDRAIFDDEDVRTFLWMLDDMWWGDAGLPSLVALSREPKRFGEALARAPEGDRLGMAARGLLDFLEAAARLDRLLVRAAPLDELAQHAWRHYAYWLVRVAALRAEVHAMLDALSRWQLGETSAPDIEPWRAAIERLLSGPAAYAPAP